MKKIINNYKESIFIFVLFFLYSLIDYLGNYMIYTQVDFDSQELLTWDYLSTTAHFVYKDFYYPYGIIYYLKNQNFLFLITYILIPSILFTVIFIFLKKLWKDKVIAYVTFFSFILFIFTITSISVFSRYGIIFVVGILYSFLFNKYKKISSKVSLILGMFNGIIFSLVYDQGLYSIILFTFCLIVSPLINLNINIVKTKSYYQYLYKKIFWFAVGLALTSTLFFLYLYRFDSIYSFLTNITLLADNAKYGKVPFLHSLKSPDNIFVTLFLLIGLVFVAYKIYRRRFNRSLHSYAILIVIFLLLILEQKSIIRSVDTQITFFSYFLAILLFYEFYIYLKMKSISRLIFIIYFTLFFIATLFEIGLSHQKLQMPPYFKKFQNAYLGGILDPKSITAMRIDKSLEYIQSTKPEYFKLKEVLTRYKDFNGVIYSFPGDPIFYILFKQSPPYYSAIYQASPLYAQNKLIRYIQDQKINYIIYNYKNFAIQDEVPNYVRSTILHRYILNNFYPKEKVENFLILERNSDDDFFKNKIFNTLPDFKKYMLRVDLQSIPRSEGVNKKHYLQEENVEEIYPTSSFRDMNNFLKGNSIDSRGKYIVLIYKNSGEIKKDIELTIKTKDGFTTNVHFKAYGMEIPYIINLDRIPLFYKTRVLESVLPTDGMDIDIKIVSISGNSLFW